MSRRKGQQYSAAATARAKATRRRNRIRKGLPVDTKRKREGMPRGLLERAFGVPTQAKGKAIPFAPTPGSTRRVVQDVQIAQVAKALHIPVVYSHHRNRGELPHIDAIRTWVGPRGPVNRGGRPRKSKR